MTMNRQLLDDDVPTDPQLDALLDEALRPTEASADLADRIVSATLPYLPGQSSAVVARIGPRLTPSLLGVAAAVGLVASVGIALWFTGSSPTTPTNSLALLHEDMAQINQAMSSTADQQIDEQIDVLNLQVSLAESTVMWVSQDELLDLAITHYELDRYAEDLEFMF
jgi:hypothetical protein